MPETRTRIEFVVEGLTAGGSWRTFAASPDADQVQGEYDRWRQSRDRNRGGIRFRIVKRTAVITDEVIEAEGEQ